MQNEKSDFLTLSLLLIVLGQEGFNSTGAISHYKNFNTHASEQLIHEILNDYLLNESHWKQKYKEVSRSLNENEKFDLFRNFDDLLNVVLKNLDSQVEKSLCLFGWDQIKAHWPIYQRKEMIYS